MSVWLVVPIRSLRDGKRRLSPVLDASRRAALVEWMFVRTLDQAAQFPGLDRTLIVTACEEARACAAARGVRVVSDGGTADVRETAGLHGTAGLNDALALAQSAVADLDATHMLVVSADLPSLGPDDLRACAAAATGQTIALAPDRGREGTNGICLPTSCAFDFSFGADSFARHLEHVRRLGMQAAVVERPGLAFDVDLPAHLSELAVLRTVAEQISR